MYNQIPDIPDNAPVDMDVIKDAKAGITQMGKDLISNKMKEATLIRESIADGGPSSANEALINLMDYCNVGIRYLASKVKVRRKQLTRMIEGEVPMPPEVFTAIYEVFKQRKPELFAFEKNNG